MSSRFKISTFYPWNKNSYDVLESLSPPPGCVLSIHSMKFSLLRERVSLTHEDIKI